MLDERKKIIDELQKKAESVLALKQEHRQKRPIVIEFSGSPKAGKTSCINSLELFLKRNGFSVKIVQERANVCPVSDKQSPMFNLWTACMTLGGLIGTLEDKKSDVDVLILDRGIFDALCWFEWLSENKKMEESQRKITEQFLLMEELVKCIDIVFAFSVTPQKSIEREFANLLTNKMGSIMNEKVLGEYRRAIENTVENNRSFFHKVFEIDTSDKNQDEVSKDVTSMTLDTLRELLMEKIGYLEKNEKMISLLSENKVCNYDELKDVIPTIQFELRDKVENKMEFLQPIPVAVITNKERSKVLAIKKNRNATSDASPERDKVLLYVGGHSRYEDSTEVISKDFILICRSALKREIKEEIGIAVALNDVMPFLIYSEKEEQSKRHVAVCFLVELDEAGIELRLDSNELMSNRGKSKSGKFLSFEDVCQESELEEWSKVILEYCFNVDYSSNKQITLGEDMMNENMKF